MLKFTDFLAAMKLILEWFKLFLDIRENNQTKKPPPDNPKRNTFSFLKKSNNKPI